jgi:hypothetical protein
MPQTKSTAMISYLNLSGDSGVVGYEFGYDFIKVRFGSSATIYVYDHSRPGAVPVDAMKRLVAAGAGLATYISLQGKADYSRKE